MKLIDNGDKQVAVILTREELATAACGWGATTKDTRQALAEKYELKTINNVDKYIEFMTLAMEASKNASDKK